MNRLTVIKTLMKRKRLKKYLEIGVSNGHIFFRIKTGFKVAVDPCFAFGKMRVFGKLFINPYNLFNKYYRVASDDFFLKNAQQVFRNTKPDIILIDGMHEYEYALRDIENALSYLPDNGVIIVHDCNPLTKEAAGTWKAYEEGNRKSFWNGDVWKAILHLQCTRQDVNLFVLDCDHGLGIITKGKPEQVLHYTQKEIDGFSYDDFAQNRHSWLNLKKPEYFHEFFGL